MRYDAFISYRHSEIDTFVAQRVHKQLETFKVPRSVRRKSGKKKLNRVFRDQEELPIGNDLNNNIETALAESEYLIVICSPRTPESEWVNKEISTFIQLHDREHILAVLVEGEPYESFPELLLKDQFGNNVEPLAADVRGIDNRERKRKLKTEIVRLVAPLLHCNYDDLRQRHRERKVKKMMAIFSALIILAISFGVYSSYNAYCINQNYQEKLVSQSKVYAASSLEATNKGDRRAGALIALEALPSEDNNRPFVPEVEYSLSESLNLYSAGTELVKEALLKHDAVVKDMVENEDGTVAVSCDNNSYVYIWNLQKGTIVNKLLPRILPNGNLANVNYIALFEDRVIVGDELGIYSVEYNGNIIWERELNNLCKGDMNYDQSLLAVGAPDSILIMNPKTGKVIHEIKNKDDYSFFSKCDFSKDSKYFAYASSNTKMDNKLRVTIYSLEDKESNSYDINTQYINSIKFVKDNAVVSYSNALNHDGKQYVASYNIKKRLWKTTLKVSNEYFEYKSDMDYSEYMNRIVWNDTNKIRLIDPDTGKVQKEVEFAQNIAKCMVSSSSYLYILFDKGTIDAIDMKGDLSNCWDVFDNGEASGDLLAKGGTILIKNKNSETITVCKYSKDEDAKEFAGIPEEINDIEKSTNENYISVATDKAYYFYSNDGKLKSSYVFNEEDISRSALFIDDKRFLMIVDRKLVCYNVETKEEQKIDLGMDEYLYPTCKILASADGKKIVIYNNTQFTLVDVASLKVENKGELNYGNNMVITRDGKKAYRIENQKLVSLNLETGKTDIVNTHVDMHLTNSIGQTLQISKDDTKLGIVCNDGKVRVLNLQSEQIENEIEFYGIMDCFISFSDDNKMLLLQGDDRIPRVYNLEKKSCVAKFRKLSGMLDRVEKLNNGNYIIGNSYELIITDSNFNRLSDIKKGVQYLKKSNKILVRDYKTIYTFKCLDLDEIVKKAKDMLGDDKLSEEERIEYNMD